MKVLCCGDRNFTAYQIILRRLAQFQPGTIIIEGEAKGADSLSRDAANDLGFEVEQYPADWEKYGRAAGPIRNTQMLKEGKPDLVLAFHDDITNSKGTKNMIAQATKAGIPVEVITSCAT